MTAPGSRHPDLARGWLALALAVTLACPPAASGEPTAAERRVRRLKAIHQEILLGGAGRHLDDLRALPQGRGRRLARAFRSRSPRGHREAFGPQGRSGRPAGLAAAQDAGPIPANQPIGASPQPFTTQSEVALAGMGSSLVAAWNDAATTGGFVNGIGFATSEDGGRSWTPGGPLPRAGGVAVWISDPVVAVDARRGWFYVAGLVIADGPRNAVAVVRGSFGASGFQWEVPRLARATRDTFPDKPWMAADSSTGNVYLTYTSFFRRQSKNSDQIEIQRSVDQGQNWSPALKLSLDEEDGLVQGSRPATGPDGELHVVWKTIDTTAAAGGLDAIHLRTSRDGGRTFGPLATVAHLYTNFCSGPPGFDRGSGLGFPSIALDRGVGPHRGRTYVAWEEALNFYDDPLGGGEDMTEAEPNNSRASATPFTLGAAIHAQVAPSQDVDWYRFRGRAGQTVLVDLDSLESRLNVTLRLWCGDGQTRLAYSAPLTIRDRVLVFTLPTTGDYYVTVAPENDSTGTYRLSTGLAERGPERGRDQRDVFAAFSDDGVTWSEPARVNDDPPWFDDWLPELAVGPDGKPFIAWYDWREGDPAGCGAASNVALARSDDGGAAWSALGPVTDVPTLWSAVSSNLVPNMGDYIALLADERAVYPSWADGRGGDPDVYLAIWPLPETARQVAPLGGGPVEGGLLVRWQTPLALPMVATAYRQTTGSEEVAVAALGSDADGVFALFDPDPQPGFRYRYRLGIRSSEGETFAGEQRIDAPASGLGALAIERLQPNPSPGAFRIAFRRANLSPARVEVLDLAGRRVFERTLGEEYGLRGILDLGAGARLQPGLYVVRIVQAGRDATAKAVVLN